MPWGSIGRVWRGVWYKYYDKSFIIYYCFMYKNRNQFCHQMAIRRSGEDFNRTNIDVGGDFNQTNIDDLPVRVFVLF